MRTVFRGESISYGYDKHHLILKDVSITIPDQSIYGLIGPAGAGKTTLAKVMLGLEKSVGGTITWFNERINSSTNRRVGYVPYKKALIYDLSVYENVMLFGKLYKYRGARLKQQAQQALQFVGLWDDRKKRVSSLPPELKQQLNIACGIVHVPDVVIFDEPIKGMERVAKPLIMENIRQLHEFGVTIIYLSQNVEEIENLCTHVGIMQQGNVIAQGKIEDLLEQHYQHCALVRLELNDSADKLQHALSEYNISEVDEHAMVVELKLDGEQELQRIKTILGDKLLRMDFVNPQLQQIYSFLTNRSGLSEYASNTTIH